MARAFDSSFDSARTRSWPPHKVRVALPERSRTPGLWPGNRAILPRRFKIWGERCSGTNYLHALIQRNLPQLRPGYRLRWKHGYAPLVAAGNDCLHLFVVRNPFDWLLSLAARPWHAPADRWGLPLEEFLRKPWISDWHDRGRSGLRIRSEVHPLDGSPLAGPLELRRIKLAHLLMAWRMLPATALLRYEDLAADPAPRIAALARAFGLNTPTRFRAVTTRKGHWLRPFRPRAHPQLPAELHDDILAQLDHDIERALGYLPDRS